MYVVDGNDRVVALSDVPQSSIGAPCPAVLCDEHRLFLVYSLEEHDPQWDGTTVPVVDPARSADAVTAVLFGGYYAHMFGSPNDEAFHGHPLSSRGLRPYGAFEIENSSWIRRLERMDSVHPNHSPERFAELRHYVFAFHDSTFECVAENFAFEVMRGPVYQVIGTLVERLPRE